MVHSNDQTIKFKTPQIGRKTLQLAFKEPNWSFGYTFQRRKVKTRVEGRGSRIYTRGKIKNGVVDIDPAITIHLTDRGTPMPERGAHPVFDPGLAYAQHLAHTDQGNTNQTAGRHLPGHVPVWDEKATPFVSVRLAFE